MIKDNTSNNQEIEEIVSLVNLQYIFFQTAEECSELNKAILKLWRAERNYTPVPTEEAFCDLLEEIADVKLCLAVLEHKLADSEIETISSIYDYKTSRWLKRLKGGQKNDN